MSPEERESAIWSVAKNGVQAFGSSVMTNAIQQQLETEPVDTVRGHLDETFTDLVINSLGFSLEIIRKHNSKNHAKGVVGRGFSINVDTRIIRDDICALVILPDSSVEMFVKRDGQA